MSARFILAVLLALVATGFAAYDASEETRWEFTNVAWGQGAAATPAGTVAAPTAVAAGGAATTPANLDWRPIGATSATASLAPTAAVASPATIAASPTAVVAPAAAPVAASRGATAFGSSAVATTAGLTPAAAAAIDPLKRPGLKVTAGNGTLPNEAGQVWREYDISSYTSRVTSTKRPEQAVIDWILRETGYEAWHSEPLGILSATPRMLRVYHTPQMQTVVANLVERFMVADVDQRAFSLRVVSVENPNWRARAQRLLKSVPVQTPGVSAWLLQKEDAVLLMSEVQRRTDFREHSPPLVVSNGQATVVSAMRARPYVREVVARDVWPGFESQAGQVDEGFALDFSPLMSVDRKTIDAAIKCDIDQVEKLVPVVIDVASTAGQRQRAKIEVPQMTHFRFHERFRWPVDQVLIVGMGMVALPAPADPKGALAGLALGGAPRADLLVIVESKGPTVVTPATARAVTPDSQRYRRPF